MEFGVNAKKREKNAKKTRKNEFKVCITLILKLLSFNKP